MGLFHHITVFLISGQEKESFLEAGIEFTDVIRGPRGESVNLTLAKMTHDGRGSLLSLRRLRGAKAYRKNIGFRTFL
jgi:hypothetical protein